MTDPAESSPQTPLQNAVANLIASSGKTREHYDRIIRDRTGTKGKPIYDIQRGKSRKPGVETLQLIADAFGVSLDTLLPPVSSDLESNAKVVAMEGPSMLRMRQDLPVYGTAIGSPMLIDGEAIDQTMLNQGEIIQYVKRPVILDGRPDAYGLYVVGDSMDPVHLEGDLIVVEMKRPARIGDDVVVYLRPTGDDDDGERARCVLVKRLVKKTASFIELRSFNPARVFQVPMKDVVRIDRVLRLADLIS